MRVKKKKRKREEKRELREEKYRVLFLNDWARLRGTFWYVRVLWYTRGIFLSIISIFAYILMDKRERPTNFSQANLELAFFADIFMPYIARNWL